MAELHFVMLQNELGVLEFIHCFVEILDRHFGQVTISEGTTLLMLC
jgi:hypothetical protein